MAHIPKKCYHKGTGQAYVTDPQTGKEVYLGVAAVPDRDLRCSPPYELLQRLERPDAKNDYWRHYKQLERPGAVDGRSDRLGPSATPEA
jgi:hypothetical protein